MKESKQVIAIAGDACAVFITDTRIKKYFSRIYHLGTSGKCRYILKISRNDGRILIEGNGISKLLSEEESKDMRYVDFVAMAVIAYQALDEGVLFLHASSFVDGGKGYAYFGESGAGKTTAIRKIPVQRIYSEDTAVIRKRKGRFYLYPSPFDGKHVKYFRKPPVLLNKIFLLSKTSVNREEKLRPIIAFLAFKRSDIYFYLINMVFRNGKENSKAKRFYGLILELMAAAEVVKLKFTKD